MKQVQFERRSLSLPQRTMLARPAAIEVGKAPPSALTLPKVSLPKISAPKVRLPKISPPKISWPRLGGR